MGNGNKKKTINLGFATTKTKLEIYLTVNYTDIQQKCIPFPLFYTYKDTQFQMFTESIYGINVSHEARDMGFTPVTSFRTTIYQGTPQY